MAETRTQTVVVPAKTKLFNYSSEAKVFVLEKKLSNPEADFSAHSSFTKVAQKKN